MSNTYGTPRRILKGNRRLHRQQQPSTQLDSTTLFRNFSPSTEIEKNSTLNCESIAHLQKSPDIKKNDIPELCSSKECMDDVDLEYGKKYPNSEEYPFQENRYRSNHVELSNINVKPSGFAKCIRELYRHKQPSTLFKNFLSDIEKILTLNCEFIAHLQKSPEIKKSDIPELYSSKECMDDVDLKYGKKYPISEKYPFQENRYRSNHVELSNIHGTPSRIAKRIRGLYRQKQPSTQFDSTTLFIKNFLFSTEIDKSSTLNCESIAHLQKSSEIKKNEIPELYSSKECMDDVDLEYGKKYPISEKYPFQENRYLSNHVELSNSHYAPSSPYAKRIRERYRQKQPSTHTTLFKNFLSEIEKISTLNCESIAHFQKSPEIKKSDIPELYSSKECTDDVDLKYGKKYPISEKYPFQENGYQSNHVELSNTHVTPSRIATRQLQQGEQGFVSPDSIKSSCALNCENSPTNHQLPPQTIPEQFIRDADEKVEIYDESNINECSRTYFNHKTLPTEVCVSPQGVSETSVSLYDEIQNSKKVLNSFEKTTEPISYTCESTSPEEFKHDIEFAFNIECISSTFYPDTDEKVEIYNKSNVNECRMTNFNDKILPTEACESPQGVCETTVSLYGDIQNRKKIHNKPISYTWNSTSERFKRDTEFVFNMGHSSTFYLDTDEKVEIYDKSYINDCRRANFNHNILPVEVYESPQGVCETSVSLYDEIRNSKKVRDGLEKTTVLFVNELFLLDANGVGCLSIPESLEADFNKKCLLNSCVNYSFKKGELISSHGSQDIHYPELETNKPISSTWEGLKREQFKWDKEFVFDMEHNFISDPLTDGKLEIYDKSAIKECRGVHFTHHILQTEVYDGILKNSYVQNLYVLISLDNSQGIQYPVLKMNSLAKYLGIPRFIEEKSNESLKHFANIVEGNEVLYQSTALLDNQKENINDELCIVTSSERSDSVDFHCQFRNEYEENKELFTLPSESTLLLLDNLLFHLQNTYQIVEKEVHSWLLNSGSYQSDYEIQNFENDSSCESVRALRDENYPNNYFEKKGLTSLGIQDSEPEMNKLAKFLCNEKSTFTQENSYKSLKHLTNIDEINEEYYLSLIDNLRNTFNDKTSLASSTEQNNCVDFYCKLNNFQNDSVENKNLLILPYESTFLLLDNILFRLQNTYRNVENEVQSWLLNSVTTDQKDSKIHETNCESVTTLADENGCSTNSNCLMRFKGRNANNNVRKFYEYGWSSSDTDALSPSEGNETESDLDDSESSLEGSFKQLRTNSRASTISSGGDSNDFDDIPRFSLPPLRKSNEKKLYTKTTELFDEVSSKEWFWKNAETEISWKCTRKGRSFRSEEHCMLGAHGIPRDVLPDDFGIRATDVDKC